MKRSLVSLLIFAACLIAPQLAAADTASSEARLSQTVIASGDPVLARANLHQRFLSVEIVCFEFTFVNDLLDPGELLRITPLQLYPSLNGFGFEDVGPAPQSARTVCVTSSG